MKRLSILIFISLTSLSVWAQTQIGGSESPVYINNGKVGVGTNSPTESLDVKGNLRIQGSGDNGIGGYLRLYSDGIIGEQANWIMYNMSSNGVDYAGGGLQFWNYPADDSNGCCNQRVIFYNDGNVFIAKNLGLGTGKPISKLDVAGNIQISNADLPMGLMTEVGGKTPLLNMSLNFREPNRNNKYMGAAFRIDSRDYYSIFQWKYREAGSSEESSLMEMNRNGQLSIGTSTPGEFKLAVKGSIGASEIKVLDVSSWSDFVFDKDYQLRSINEVESFIQLNNHLPGIPTKIEVREKGVNVAEMDAMLLQKIEELTLYVIQLKNENESQNSENKELIKRVLSLEKRIGKTTN